MISGCRPDETLKQDKPPLKEEEKMTILGDKLKNPYTVRNMKAAYKNLKTGQAGGRPSPVMEEEFSIRPTHYYVRLLPENLPAYDSLVKDTSLFLHDRPIDVKVVKEADYYHDPSIPKDKPTWQYTSVPLSYKVPFGNKMEIIDTLYLAEQVEKQGGKISKARQLAMDVLENEALLLTGNLTEEEKKLRERKGGPSARTQGFWSWFLPDLWLPAGHIRVWDERVSRYIGAMGAKVRAWRWFTTGYGLVASRDGRYICLQPFRYSVSYKIIWAGHRYDIRDGQWWQAYTYGPTQTGDWNLDIVRGRLSYCFAHISRAIWAYNYGPALGLFFRPRNSSSVKIAMRDTGSNDRGDFRGWTWFGLAPTIHIYRYNNNNGGRENACDEFFGTTIHELTHVVHKEHFAFSFWSISDFIIESWAMAVQLEITKEEYRALGIADYGAPSYFGNWNIPYFAGFQTNTIGYSSITNYTAIFIDLIDNYNQRGQLLGDVRQNMRGHINDNVSGFTLRDIQWHVLPSAYGLTSLRTRLKQVKVSGVTDAQIDELFQQYQ